MKKVSDVNTVTNAESF